MKTLFTLILTLALCGLLSAQTGIYMTYDDFRSGNLVKADDNTRINVKESFKHEISMQVNGKSKTYVTKDFFAILNDGELYRFAPNIPGNVDLKLTTVDDHYAMWWYTETRHYTNGHDSRSTLIYVSKGLDGKLLDITNNSQMKEMESLSDFKDLVACIKSGKKLSLMHPIGMAAGECIYNDPTYRKDPKSVIPPIR